MFLTAIVEYREQHKNNKGREQDSSDLIGVSVQQRVEHCGTSSRLENIVPSFEGL